jgi:short/branched chain acyl-CoA dehydrogenase
MDLDLGENQLMIQKAVRDFAAREIAPYSAQWDERAEFPAGVIRALGELGVTGLLLPEEYGGGGGDMLSMVVALEELAKVDASVAVTIDVVAGLCGQLLVRFGSEEQKRRWLTSLAQGETIAAFALTEPDAGSDAAGISTRAELVDGHWVINGSKVFITNSGTPMTAFVVVAAVTGRDEAGNKEFSTIIVPNGTPGFSAGPPHRKLGWHASDTRPLSFEECRVPEANLLGPQGRGLAQCLWALDAGRVGIAAMGVGLAEACLQLSLAFAKERYAFGEPIAKLQAIQLKLADMAVGVELSRLATYRAAVLMDQNRPFKKEAAIAKLYSSETAVKVVDEALQIHGGIGYMEDGPIARFYRDAKILTIGEGTSEVQRLVIARELGC